MSCQQEDLLCGGGFPKLVWDLLEVGLPLVVQRVGVLQLQLQLWDLVQNLLRLAEKIFTHKIKAAPVLLKGINQYTVQSKFHYQQSINAECKVFELQAVCVLSACLFSGEVWWGVEEEDGGQEEDKEGEGDQQDPPVPRTRHPAMWIESTLRLYTSGVDQNPSVSELYGLIRIS